MQVAFRRQDSLLGRFSHHLLLNETLYVGQTYILIDTIIVNVNWAIQNFAKRANSPEAVFCCSVCYECCPPLFKFKLTIVLDPLGDAGPVFLVSRCMGVRLPGGCCPAVIDCYG